MRTNWVGAILKHRAAILLAFLGLCRPMLSQEVSLALLRPEAVQPSALEPVPMVKAFQPAATLPEAPSHRRFWDRENTVLFRDKCRLQRCGLRHHPRQPAQWWTGTESRNPNAQRNYGGTRRKLRWRNRRRDRGQLLLSQDRSSQTGKSRLHAEHRCLGGSRDV